MQPNLPIAAIISRRMWKVKRPRKMLTLGMLALALLLGGAIVNVAVAWGCAMWIEISNSINPDSQGGVWPAEGGHFAWHGERWDRSGACRVSSSWCDPDCNLGLIGDWGSNRPEPIIPSWAINVLPPRETATRQLQHTRVVDARGWPMLAMCSRGSMDVIYVKMGPFKIENGVVIDRKTAPYPSKILPLTPIWPGFAINTIFYAAILWMAFALPLALRRRRRLKRGLCPACAYPIGASSVCTECGSALQVSASRLENTE